MNDSNSEYETVDLNVNNYSINELFTILGLNDPLTVTNEDIINATNKYITQFTHSNNSDMVSFFKDIKNVLKK